MWRKATNKTDIIEDYYKRCKRIAFCSLVIAVISVIVGMLVIRKLTAISFLRDVSLLQIGLFIFLALIMLGIAGTAVFLHLFYIRRQKEYVEYLKEKQFFSACAKTVDEIEKREDRDQMRIYIIKSGMSRFR